MKIVGLQTHIWENNSKSIMLLILFPVILGILLYSAIFATTAFQDPSQECTYNSAIDDTICIAVEESDYSLINNNNEIFMIALPYFLGGIGLWFLIAWIANKDMITGLTGAQPINRSSAPELYNLVENLCISRGLRVPSIYIIEDQSMNAFAYGLTSKDTFIAFTRGLLDRLTPDEVEAVAAHELTHIINKDSRMMLIAIIFVGIIQTVAEIILRTNINVSSDDNKKSGAIAIVFVVKILAFILGFLVSVAVQAMISRKREFMADAGAVELTKTSDHMISALEKISQDSDISAVSNHNVAQLFIVNPLSEHKNNFFTSMFATHPSVHERINALKQIG